MCTVCGCATGSVAEHDHHDHDHEHHDHDHTHDHHHHDDHDHSHHHGDINYGAGPARAHAPGLSQSRMIQIEQNILSKNDEFAQTNRDVLADAGILALNLVSSPGSGKTTLLVETINRLKEKLGVYVIEGDQQTSNDADRIRATGVKAIQINTGKGCHLDAQMVEHAMDHLELEPYSLLFIENVGNLVCPAAFDLGENHKVAILSVTEGEDKPIKYPDMFAAADIMLLNKVDLLPYLKFDVAACIAFARKVNPNIKVIELSAQSGQGFEQWLEWLLAERAQLLEARKAQLNAQLSGLNAALSL
jgi:hydrogenase nickel incorporation protein HypB